MGCPKVLFLLFICISFGFVLSDSCRGKPQESTTVLSVPQGFVLKNIVNYYKGDLTVLTGAPNSAPTVSIHTISYGDKPDAQFEGTTLTVNQVGKDKVNSAPSVHSSSNLLVFLISFAFAFLGRDKKWLGLGLLLICGNLVFSQMTPVDSCTTVDITVTIPPELLPYINADLASGAVKGDITIQRWSEVYPDPSKIGASVTIPSKVKMVYDVINPTNITNVTVMGILEFDSEMSTLLVVGTLEIKYGGSLIMHPNANVNHTVMFQGTLIPQYDPELLRVGLLGYGFIDIQGAIAPKVHWRRVVTGNNTRLVVDSSTDWNVGEYLYVNSVYSNYGVSSVGDHVKIVAINGNTITVDPPLSRRHDGYVAHVTRNVIFKNVLKRNTTQPLTGDSGHIFFNANASASVRAALFQGLGRTTIGEADATTYNSDGSVNYQAKNPKGRYALHCHWCLQKFLFQDNVIYNTSRWGIVNHRSFGDIVHNVAIGAPGAGLVGEDGPETGTMRDNFVIGNGGGTGYQDTRTPTGAFSGLDMVGHCGSGLWTMSPFIEYTYNYIVGQFECEAYNIAMNSFVTQMPKIPGMPANLYNKTLDILYQPLTKFDRNTADAEVTRAEFRGSLRMWGGDHRSTHQYFTATNYVSYKLGLTGQGYQAGMHIYDSVFMMRNVIINYPHFFDLDGSAYDIFQNVTVTGFQIGIRPGGRKERMFINNCHFDNVQNMVIPYTGIHWEGWLWGQLIKVTDTTFGPGPIALETSEMFDQVLPTDARDAFQLGGVWLQSLRRVEFYNFNNTGEDLALQIPQSAHDYVIPLSKFGFHDSDLTNAQSKEIYGRTINDFIVYPPYDVRPNFPGAYVTDTKRREIWVAVGYSWGSDGMNVFPCPTPSTCNGRGLPSYHLGCPLENECQFRYCYGCPTGPVNLTPAQGLNKWSPMLNISGVVQKFTFFLYGYPCQPGYFACP